MLIELNSFHEKRIAMFTLKSFSMYSQMMFSIIIVLKRFVMKKVRKGNEEESHCQYRWKLGIHPMAKYIFVQFVIKNSIQRDI
jgi:hypothetical protein